MSSIVVLDTDVWSALFIHPKPDVRVSTWREQLIGATVVIATQTWAEVLFGMDAAGWGDARRNKVNQQLDAATIVPVNTRVVEAFARLRGDCVRAGHGLHQKLHMGDAWVAATAIAINAPLLSGDGIYRKAPGLELL